MAHSLLAPPCHQSVRCHTPITDQLFILPHPNPPIAKASELKEEVVEALRVDPAPSTSAPPQQQPPQQPQAAAGAAAEAPVADSRATSIHLCGFDIEGVSIAGQVRSGADTCVVIISNRLIISAQ